jgi:hypothetical protein
LGLLPDVSKAFTLHFFVAIASSSVVAHSHRIAKVD